MLKAKPLEALFLVDYSDFAFRTIAFVAQLADAVPLKLTLLHAHDGRESAAVAEERLASFFAEADRYPSCKRVVAVGEVLEVLEHRVLRSPIDLLLMPASTPSTLARLRPGNPSHRLRAVELLRRPLWTVGPPTQLARLGQQTRNVACWVDLRASSHPQLAFASEYARALGAQLHVLTEVPELTLNVITDESVPLHPNAAAERLRQEVNELARPTNIWVAEQSLPKERQRLIDGCAADVLFVPQGHPPMLEWFGTRPVWFSEPSCPVVMIPNEPAMRRWSLMGHEDLEPAQRQLVG